LVLEEEDHASQVAQAPLNALLLLWVVVEAVVALTEQTESQLLQVDEMEA
jgi:hypothetical protein